MEQTTLPPLVSDEQILRPGRTMKPTAVRDRYEVERKRLNDGWQKAFNIAHDWQEKAKELESARSEDAKLITKLRAEHEELLGALEGIVELAYSSRLDEALDEAREIMAKHKPE